MKKLLAFALVLALLFAAVVPAFAQPPPTPTHITAEWIGTVTLHAWTLLPRSICQHTVAITLHFEQGEPQVLEAWEEHPIAYSVNNNGVITFTYHGMQASLNYLARYIAQREYIPRLELNESTSWEAGLLHLFTPQQSREHHFFAPGSTGTGEGLLRREIKVFDADLRLIASGTSQASARLVAGETYYVFADRVTAQDSLTFIQRFPWITALLGGSAFFMFFVGMPAFVLLTLPITWPFFVVGTIVEFLRRMFGGSHP